MSASNLATALIAWTLQIALLLGLGLLLPAMFRLREPRACLTYGQGLLLAVLLLPLLQSLPQTATTGFSMEMTVSGRWLGQLGASGPAAGSSWSWPHLLLLSAGLGTALRLAWLGAGLLLLRSWRRRARPAEVAPEAAEVLEELGAGAHLLVSSWIDSPVTFGWRRPAILLPTGFTTLPAEAQRGIVCHELLHVRRRDWLFALWEEGVRALLWFHPAVWLLLARIALHREQVVDGEVVRLTGSRRAYLEALHAMARRSRQLAVPGLPFFHRGHLRQRVAHLCKEVPMSHSRVVVLVSTFAGLLVLTVALGILAFPMAGKTWAAAEPPAAPIVVPQDAELRRNRSQGPVTVKGVVDERGKLQNLTIEKSSGDPGFDQEALKRAARRTIQPATLLRGKTFYVTYS